VLDFGDNTFVMLQAQTVSQAHGQGLELGAERGSIVFGGGGFRVYERTDEIGTWGRGERLLAEGQPIPKAPGEERTTACTSWPILCTWSTVSQKIGSPAPAPSTPAM
jgi:hypothetical protein